MGEQNSIPTWVLLVIGLGTPVSTIVGIFVTAWMGRRASADSRDAAREAREAAHDATGAAKDAATLVAEVAIKTEEVKVELKVAGQETTSKLIAIEEQGEKIHALVNNAFSEQLRRYAVIADLLLATDRENPEFQRLSREAHAEVAAHAPAESTKAERDKKREERGDSSSLIPESEGDAM
jgi:hypothetical protein